MNCQDFRRQIVHFQADEIEAAERERLQAHLDACPDCARRLEFEDALLAALRTRLSRVPAPQDLAPRIRAALDGDAAVAPSAQAPVRRDGGVWYRSRWVAAAAAAVLLALIVGPRLLDRTNVTSGAPIRVVDQAVLVVDAECERKGLAIALQRECRDPQHFNKLRLAGGDYWSVSLNDDLGPAIVLAPEMRGRRLVVEGDLYPEILTLRVERYRLLDSVRSRSPRPPAPGAGGARVLPAGVRR